ncbi:tetratricopeptide repeat protein [Bacteroides thetaiotaomicron]|uniref:tetratricopeptide repeat protein n=1 Tax=Bacteroides thetaiotaomicron TaxID=818 RepID=UPI0039C05241
MKRIILLAFLCTTTLVMAQRINHVQEAIANYDYEAALTLIAKEKPTIPLLLQKGKAQRGLGMNTEALSTYQEIITNDTANTRAYIEAAECCRSLAKYQQALKYYEQALDLNPENKYVRIQYIGLLLSLQKFQDALGESSLMTEKDSSAIALHLQAQSFEGMGELLPATGCYYNIQEKYPDDYLAAAKLAALNIAGSYFNEAIEATEKYRQIDTTNIAVNRQNALAYCLNKDYPTAIQRYEYLVNQGDSSFHTCYYLGISYYAEEKYYEAHDFLEAARKHDPENVNLLYYLGRACAKTSWKKLGVEYLEKALDLTIPKDSNMVRLYIGMTDCYKMAQMPKEQIESIRERYRKYDKQNHKLLYDMAFIYFYSLKDKKNTERCLEAFLKTRPKEDKEEEAKLNERGELVLGTKNYYNAAANWLKDIQSKQKIEDFFLGGNVPAQKPE